MVQLSKRVVLEVTWLKMLQQKTARQQWKLSFGWILRKTQVVRKTRADWKCTSFQFIRAPSLWSTLVCGRHVFYFSHPSPSPWFLLLAARLSSFLPSFSACLLFLIFHLSYLSCSLMLLIIYSSPHFTSIFPWDTCRNVSFIAD